MTDLDMTALREAAKKATPGPWGAFTTGRSGGDHWYVCDADEVIAHISANDGDNEAQRQPDADFIAAANPAVVLELLDRLERAELVLATVRARLERALDNEEE